MNILCMLFLLTLCQVAIALPEVGSELPSLTIADREDMGELVLVDGEVNLRAWSTEGIKGSWTLIQHMAARSGPSKLNRHVVDQVADLVKQDYLKMVNIINIHDVTLGMTSLALREMKKNKARYKLSSLIADMDSAREAWELESRSSSIILLDENNIVRFYKGGLVSDNELTELKAIIIRSRTRTSS